jgi:hypothetical protein
VRITSPSASKLEQSLSGAPRGAARIVIGIGIDLGAASSSCRRTIGPKPVAVDGRIRRRAPGTLVAWNDAVGARGLREDRRQRELLDRARRLSPPRARAIDRDRTSRRSPRSASRGCARARSPAPAAAGLIQPAVASGEWRRRRTPHRRRRRRTGPTVSSDQEKHFMPGCRQRRNDGL